MAWGPPRIQRADLWRQAGREQRQIEPLDVTPIMQQLCEGIRPLAQQRRLFLRCDGPPGFSADGDSVKIRRIAQNLILNAVKFTRDGGITVSWGDSDVHDSRRWALCVTDTGPGFHGGSDKPLALALEHASGNDPAAADAEAEAAGAAADARGGSDGGGEGIGLSIVKRLCELLDATLEMKSVKDVGTTFRILFPRVSELYSMLSNGSSFAPTEYVCSIDLSVPTPK